MNKQQQKAAKQLERALIACHKAGLKGGVYDCHFYLWPEDATPDPRDHGHFFDNVDAIGARIVTLMILDGGSGV